MNKLSVFLSLTLLLPTLLAGCSSFPYFSRQTSTPVATPNSVHGEKEDTGASNTDQGDNLKGSVEQQGSPDSQSEDTPEEEIEPADQGSYLVRHGDTLSLIAQAFAVTTEQLQYRNNIRDPNLLQVGTYLTIPDNSFEVPHDFFNSGPEFVWPLKQLDITSEFGTRAGQHEGMDIRAPRDTEILSAADGVVLFAGTQSGYGKTIVIQHADNVKTLYAHNHKNLVRKGQKVKKGDVIATVGKSGNATGYHVHFEYIKDGQKLNPRLYVYQDNTPSGEEVALNR